MSAVVKVAGKELGPVQARKLTDTIRAAAEIVWDLIAQAYSERAWSALGYASWDEYCQAEFGATRLRLPREDRTEVVASLRDSGLSLRAIEAATGVSRPTIIKDLAKAQVVNSLPPEPPGGVTEATPGQTDRVVAALAAANAKQDVAQGGEPIVVPEKITGTDGKTYKKKPVVEPPPAISEEEAMRRAARIAELSAWGKACDGLLAALSFAASSVPPEDTDRYPAVETFIERYDALGNHINNKWIADADSAAATVAEVATLEHEDNPKKLRTWCGGRAHEFDSWDAVYAALAANLGALSTAIGTLASPAYRVSRTVKIPLDEAEFMCGELKDLQAALMALLDNRDGESR